MTETRGAVELLGIDVDINIFFLLAVGVGAFGVVVPLSVLLVSATREVSLRVRIMVLGFRNRV